MQERVAHVAIGCFQMFGLYIFARRDSKIAYLEAAVLVQHIGGLEISVEEIKAMHDGEGGGDLEGTANAHGDGV